MSVDTSPASAAQDDPKAQNDPKAAPREPFQADGKTARCQAWSRTAGAQCGQRAVTGHQVCRWHGAGSPQAQRAAQLRVIELLDPALATVARIMADPREKAADRLRAAENVMDRGGLPRRAEISQDEGREILRRRLLAYAEALNDPETPVPTISSTATPELEGPR